MSKRYFCTHFDINYLPHARSLADSLFEFSSSSELITFCMDNESFESLNQSRPKNVRIIHFSQLESTIPNLLSAKNNRTKVEYFYTCSPAICNFCLNYLEGITEITYLDADLYFFSDPEPIFNELGNNSVGIIEHRFSYFTKRNKIYGNFNVGWITFKKDNNGIACLNDWTKKCIDWCYQKLEDGRYADQKYLDSWKCNFEGVCIIENIGANLAIWNIGNYTISLRKDKVYVDDKELIFYHFANFKQIGLSVFQTNLSRVFVKTSGIVRENIYLPYIKNISKYLDSNKLIISKKEINLTSISELVRKVTRIIRQSLFPDIIKIKNVKE